MSLVTIIQDACDQIGLPRPTSVVGNTDPSTVTMLALLNREGKALAQCAHPTGGWTVLQREHTFTTSDGTAEYALPDDFDHFIDDTAWDRVSYWQMRGPLSPQDWQVVKSGLAATPALRRRWRVKRSASSATRKFYVDPTPTADGDTLVFEYVGNQWVQNAAGDTLYTKWNADTDVSLLDETLLTMGLVWRFKQSKGLEYRIDLAEYEVERDKLIGRDGGAERICFAKHELILPPGNVPDTGYGV